MRVTWHCHWLPWKVAVGGNGWPKSEAIDVDDCGQRSSIDPGRLKGPMIAAVVSLYLLRREEGDFDLAQTGRTSTTIYHWVDASMARVAVDSFLSWVTWFIPHGSWGRECLSLSLALSIITSCAEGQQELRIKKIHGCLQGRSKTNKGCIKEMCLRLMKKYFKISPKCRWNGHFVWSRNKGTKMENWVWVRWCFYPLFGSESWCRLY